MGIFSRGLIIRVIVVVVAIIVIGCLAKYNHETRFIGHTMQGFFDTIYHYFSRIFG